MKQNDSAAGGWLFFIGIIVITIYFYNRLISRRNQITNAYGAIDVVLKQRFDLIPNLVKCVQGYTTHEEQVLTLITSLRKDAAQAVADAESAIVIDTKLSGALALLMTHIENYPELKSDRNFRRMQEALDEVELSLSAARRNYNQSVKDYNDALETFPSNQVARLFRMKRRSMFRVAPPEGRAPAVDVGFNG